MDLAEIARHHNNKRGQNNWSILYDLNNDGVVDVFDLVSVSKNIGIQ
jgi:Ca2+-binding EF-hand superfamily protein